MRITFTGEICVVLIIKILCFIIQLYFLAWLSDISAKFPNVMANYGYINSGQKQQKHLHLTSGLTRWREFVVPIAQLPVKAESLIINSTGYRPVKMVIGLFVRLKA